MRRTPAVIFLLVPLLLLSGCAAPLSLPSDFTPPPFLAPLLERFMGAEDDETADGPSVWRAAAEPAAGGELVRAELLPDPDADLEDLLAAFCAPSAAEGLQCALPAGVSVAGHRLENGVVTLELSANYLEQSEMSRAVTALCAALTLCQVDGVEAVTVTAGGQTVFAGLMPEDALLTADDADPYVRQLRLYFPDGDGRYLVSEYHSLTLDEDTSPERYVIEELLRGPNNGELQSVIPAGTALRSCTTVDGVCTVDLTAEFYDNRPDTPLGERLLLYSIVDSLTALSVVDSVRILVEGASVDIYAFRSLAEPLEGYTEVIGPVSQPRGETDADLYLALPGLDAIAPLPFRVNETDYDSPAEAVLTALLNAQEPGYPAIFPGSGSITGLTIRGGVCTVELSESFFISLPEPARLTAVQSIGATLCALPDISAVRFTIAGGDAVFEGVDWSGPWRSFDQILPE